MNRKLLFLMILALAMFGHVNGQINAVTTAQRFPLSEVKLLESPFKHAQETDLKYILTLNPDRLLAPFLRESGLKPKAESYGNWENTGLDGHTGGHYLSALALMEASTGNPTISTRLSYMLSELKKCQEANGDGYIGGIPGGKTMWNEIGQGKIKAYTFSLNDKWVPLYNLHKLFAGLYDAATLTGNKDARTMLIQLTNWFDGLTSKLSDAQIQQMLKAEPGGMNEALANVYFLTGDKKYLHLARRFSHQAILDPLLKGNDALNGLHANTQIPKIIGFERIAQWSADTSWHKASQFFWETVTGKRTVAFGGNSVREHFNPIDDFSPMLESREGPETCNSYNMLKLTGDLFLANPSSKYIDYYERTMYNHILSSQRPEGGFVYFTPIRPAHYRVYSQPHEGFWCCVGSGMENHGKYGDLIYAHTQSDIFVNLFLPSTLTWKEKGITITQQTSFPTSETSKLTLKLVKPTRFSLNVRYPSWIANGKMTIFINGKAQVNQPGKTGYVSLTREWKSGDVITLGLPMQTRAEFLPDGSDWVAFLRGPILLAADMGKQGLVALNADGSRMGHIAAGSLFPLDEAPLLVAKDRNLATAIVATSTPLTYDASKLIYQEKYRNLKLVPFYKLHNTRYTIYWPYASTANLPARIASMKEREAAKQELDSLTLDVVNTGEQQPENDHGFRGENTTDGLFAERHFRTGRGWFSYRLKNEQLNAKTIRLTYYGTEKNRKFDVYINGTLLTNVSLDGTGGAKFITVSYEIQVPTAQTFEVKFVAKDGSSIANIYEVRLMK